VTADKNQAINETSLIMQQIGLLNLRINDMMIQLNTTMKMLLDENTTLKQKTADLKAKN
jgi:hypothetical protein